MLMWEKKTTKENIGYVDESYNSQCKEKKTKQRAGVKINNEWGVDCKKISICGICCHGFDILGICWRFKESTLNFLVIIRAHAWRNF